MTKYRVIWDSKVSRPPVEVYAFTFAGAVRKARRIAGVNFLRALVEVVR